MEANKAENLAYYYIVNVLIIITIIFINIFIIIIITTRWCIQIPIKENKKRVLANLICLATN